MQLGHSNPTPTHLEHETAAYWVEVATILGLPRSIGEIYGLIFLSAEPLNADDIVLKLGISRSGVGQGLKTLSEIGAIRSALQAQSRKDHYELQTDLSVLVRLFLNSRVLPRLSELARRQSDLAERTRTGGPDHLVSRFDKLARWRDKTAPLIGILKSLASD